MPQYNTAQLLSVAKRKADNRISNAAHYAIPGIVADLTRYVHEVVDGVVPDGLDGFDDAELASVIVEMMGVYEASPVRVEIPMSDISSMVESIVQMLTGNPVIQDELKTNVEDIEFDKEKIRRIVIDNIKKVPV